MTGRLQSEQPGSLLFYRGECTCPPLYLIGGTEVDFIILNHSIYSKNEYGRILAEITFPEHREGVYCIESTHVVDEYIGTEVPGQLVEAAVKRIREQGGKVEAECPFARKYLAERGML